MARAEGIDQKIFISVKPHAESEQAKYLSGIDRTLWGLGISINVFEGDVPSRIIITRTPVDEQLSEITLVFLPKNQGDDKATALFGKALMDHIFCRGTVGNYCKYLREILVGSESASSLSNASGWCEKILCNTYTCHLFIQTQPLHHG